MNNLDSQTINSGFETAWADWVGLSAFFFGIKGFRELDAIWGPEGRPKGFVAHTNYLCTPTLLNS